MFVQKSSKFKNSGVVNFQNIYITRFDKKVPGCIFLTPSGNTAATKLHVVLLWTVYYSQ